jgi:hypothetical protein
MSLNNFLLLNYGGSVFVFSIFNYEKVNYLKKGVYKIWNFILP